MQTKNEKAISLIKKFYKKRKHAQLADLSIVLGTQSRMSIFRKMRQLNYISSYTHKGKYYTIPDAIHFDEHGLWIHESIGFSEHGNLKQTITALIESSYNGKTQSELQAILCVKVHNSLLSLYKEHLIDRVKLNGINIYTSSEKTASKQQLAQRGSGAIDTSEGLPPDWVIIEVLVAIIQSRKIEIDTSLILNIIRSKNSEISLTQINRVISMLDLKKTLDL